MGYVFNPFTGAFDLVEPVDVTANYDWTGAHTWSQETVHNGGIDVGTSGRIDSNVADAISAVNFLIKPTTSLTSGFDRFILDIRDSSDNTKFCVKTNGNIEINGRNTGGDGLVNVGNSTSFNLGINFIPSFTGAGTAITGITNIVTAAYNTVRAGAGATWTRGFANFNQVPSFVNMASSINDIGSFAGKIDRLNGDGSGITATRAAVFMAYQGESAGKNLPVFTNGYGLYVENLYSTATGCTNAYGVYIEEMNSGSTIDNGIFLAQSSSSYKPLVIRDQDIYINSAADGYLDLHADTSVRVNGGFEHLGTSLGFFSTSPVSQQADIGALTNSTGGTGDGTVAAVSGSGDDATINNNFSDLIDKINGIRTVLRNYGLMA